MSVKTSVASSWSHAIAAEELTLAGADTVEIPVIHELGADRAAAVLETTQIIWPTKRPVLVKVQSQVVGPGINGRPSAEYMASVRRRKARLIGQAIQQLEGHSARDDFAVCTFPIVQQINELLTTLANAELEGNSREILRQLRNTFMNGGWNGYRSLKAREAAAAILKSFADAEEVLPDRVEEVFDQLLEAGLEPVGAPLFAPEDAETSPDGEEEIPG